MPEASPASTIIAAGALLVALTFRRQSAGRVPTAGAPPVQAAEAGSAAAGASRVEVGEAGSAATGGSPVQAAGAGSAAAEADEGARRLNGRGGGQRNGPAGAARPGALGTDHH